MEQHDCLPSRFLQNYNPVTVVAADNPAGPSGLVDDCSKKF